MAFLSLPFMLAFLSSLICLIIQIKSRRNFIRDMEKFNQKMKKLEKIETDIEKI